MYSSLDHENRLRCNYDEEALVYSNQYSDEVSYSVMIHIIEKFLERIEFIRFDNIEELSISDGCVHLTTWKEDYGKYTYEEYDIPFFILFSNRGREGVEAWIQEERCKKSKEEQQKVRTGKYEQENTKNCS